MLFEAVILTKIIAVNALILEIINQLNQRVSMILVI
jgi:hypothetical protein